MKPWVRQNKFGTSLKNMSRLFLRLFEFKVSTLGEAVTLWKGTPKNRGWCIHDTVEIQQNDQMAFWYVQQTKDRLG